MKASFDRETCLLSWRNYNYFFINLMNTHCLVEYGHKVNGLTCQEKQIIELTC